jgi:protein involved in polysaccharide export with SLBB domain
MEMTRRNVALLVAAIVMTCAFSGVLLGQVSQTDSAVTSERPDSSYAASTATQFHERNQRYRLQRSDVIEVKFRLSPEFDQTVTVQPDGFIILDGAGDIKVEDKTLPELKEAIRRAYQGILHEPVITVALKDFVKPSFIVAGQVGHPGKYELRSDTTLVEALAIAGDLTTAAKHSQVVLFRHISSETVEARVFNVKQMLGSRNLEEDPHLLPGDLVFVPQNKISKLQRFLPTASMGAYINPTQF